MDDLVTMVKELNLGHQEAEVVEKEEPVNMEDNMNKFYYQDEKKFGETKKEKVDKRIKSRVKNEREKCGQRKNTGDDDLM